MATTPYYNMPLSDSSIDGSKTFQTYADEVNGVSAGSAMNIIDTQMKINADNITSIAGTGRTTENVKTNADNIALLKNKAQYYISATGTDTYTATSSEFAVYTSGMIILLKVPNTNTGNSTLNVNAIGALQLTKTNQSGVSDVLVAGDLKPNQIYQFRYDGTSLRLMGTIDVPADKTYILDSGNYFTGTNTESALQEIAGWLNSGTTSTPTIAYGMNNKITHSGKTSVFPKLDIVGQSYVNDMGKDGNCEDTSKFTATTSTMALNTSNKVFGANSIAITLTSTSGYITKLTSSMLAIDTSKYYLYSAYLKNSTATSLNIRTVGSVQTSSSVTSTTAFERVGILLTPAMMASITSFTVNVTGASTNIGYVDGIMVNQISSADYALGLSACLAKYLYVDSYACLQNPYLEVRHDNLVRNGSNEEGVGWWTPNATTSVLTVGGAIFTLTTSATNGYVSQLISVKPSTSYYLKGTVSGNTEVYVYDTTFTTALRTGTGTFTTSATTDKIAVLIRNNSIGSGTASSISLIEGTVAPTTYKPCRIERCVVEGKFTSDDTLTLENGEVSGLVWWKHKTLYGKDYAWTYGSDATGFKNCYISSIAPPYAQFTGIKHDGKIIKVNSGTFASGDEGYINSTGAFYVSLSDTDTGFAESIAPNDDEVRAFMNGWKATANNGTRYTAWVSVVDGTTAPTLQTIEFCKANIANSYDGYQLHYKLATPEPLTDSNVHIHGSIPKIDAGDNYIYLNMGDRLNEKANPVLSSTTYYISNTAVTASNLQYQNEDIFAVYRNGIYDSSWTIGTTTPYGNKMASCPQANYDGNSTYSVDYKILATQAPSVGALTLSYAQDVFSAINDLAETVENKQNQNSALDILVDLSLYEVGGISSGANAQIVPFLYDGTYVNFDVPIVFKATKRATPTMKLNLSIIYCMTPSITDKTSVFFLDKIVIDKTGGYARYKTNDATAIANRANNAVVAMTWVADCRERV